jgi:hypothetical protein
MISKTDYISGLQCPTLFWHRRNALEKIPPRDRAAQAAFEQARAVGDLAKRLFPGGIEIHAAHDDLDALLTESRQAVLSRHPVFEAGFSYNGAFARADILVPVGFDAWDVIEVKSATEVKDVHYQDLAFQAYVYEGAGLKVRKIILMRIDREFVRHGPIDPKGFFKQEDTTETVSRLSRGVGARLADLAAVSRRAQPPEVTIGPNCDAPYTCPLRDRCWAHLPEHTVLTLYRSQEKGFRLLGEGITTIAETPEAVRLTDNQKIQRNVILTGTPHVNGPELTAFLANMRHPIFFLDFETFGPAIPMFDGARPFEQIPFQYSLRIVRQPEATPEHHEFLADGTIDPRPELLQRLRALLGTNGSIVAYNAAFEHRILKQCCAEVPTNRNWLGQTEDRFVDLLAPFKAFHYYHPAQHGSASMKALLPALTGISYDNLTIRDGTMASLEYLRVTFGTVSPEERLRVRRQLREYCGQDTLGMIRILDQLRRLLAKGNGRS